jgi:hypothetical protein
MPKVRLAAFSKSLDGFPGVRGPEISSWFFQIEICPRTLTREVKIPTVREVCQASHSFLTYSIKGMPKKSETWPERRYPCFS